MAASIPEDEIRRVRDATDIVALIREYLPLKRAGSAHKALCPFHDEKTPSFSVNPSLQIFKCFGCGVAGDAITFVMKHDGLEFIEAVHFLAQRAGIKLRGSAGTGVSRSEARTVYDVLEWAAKLFGRWLAKGEGSDAARTYVEKRRLSPESVHRFGLGYAPTSWDALIRAAREQGGDPSALARAGLVLTNESGRTYDRFRNRLMFPIRDARGRVVGFGARALDDSEPKYLNSPETAVFHKGRTLYGIYEAADALRKRRRAVVVEGYMDVIMAHQHGEDDTVAVLGTALTRDHVRLLRRYAGKALLVFDGDEAGQNSAERSIEAFAAEGMPAQVAALPDNLDPCDLFLSEGADGFARLEASAEDLLRFMLRRAGGADPTWADPGALDRVLVVVALMPDAVARDVALQCVCEETGVSLAALSARMDSLRRPGRQRRTEGGNPDRLRRDPERQLLAVILANPECVGRVAEELDLQWVERHEVRALLALALEIAAGGGSPHGSELLGRTADESQRALIEELMGLDLPTGEAAAAECPELIGRLRALHAERHAPAVKRKLREAIGRGGAVEDSLSPEEREALALVQENARAKQRNIGFGRRFLSRSEEQ